LGAASNFRASYIQDISMPEPSGTSIVVKPGKEKADLQGHICSRRMRAKGSRRVYQIQLAVTTNGSD
jgi:hypothetical protein